MLIKNNLQKSRRRTSHSAQVFSWLTLGRTPPTLQRFLEFSRIFPTVNFFKDCRWFLRCSLWHWGCGWGFLQETEDNAQGHPHLMWAKLRYLNILLSVVFSFVCYRTFCANISLLLLFPLFHEAWYCSLQLLWGLLWLVSPSQVRAYSATLAGRGRSPCWAAPGPSPPGARGYPRPWVGGCRHLDTPTWHKLERHGLDIDD